MKKLELAFPERLKLAAEVERVLSPILPLLAVRDVLKLSEEEVKQLDIREESGQKTFFAPTPEFGRVTLEVDEAQAGPLTAVLTSYLAQSAWAEALQAQLK